MATKEDGRNETTEEKLKCPGWGEPVTAPLLLTPWSRVLLEKLTGSAASQEIPRIFGTRRFVTVPTSARHMSLF